VSHLSIVLQALEMTGSQVSMQALWRIISRGKELHGRARGEGRDASTAR
jgi:hypothetical protein